MDNLPFFTRSKGRKPDPAAKPLPPGSGLRTNDSSTAFRKAPAPAAMPSTQPHSELHRGIDAHARRKQQLERAIYEFACQTKEVEKEAKWVSQAKDKARKEAAEAESELYTKIYEVQQMQQQINTVKAAVRELEVGVEQLLAALHDAKRSWQHEMECFIEASNSIQSKQRNLLSQCPHALIQGSATAAGPNSQHG